MYSNIQLHYLHDIPCNRNLNNLFHIIDTSTGNTIKYGITNQIDIKQNFKKLKLTRSHLAFNTNTEKVANCKLINT